MKNRYFLFGYFYLRYKLIKDKSFRTEWIEKENTLDDDDKVLFKTCLLPDRIFHEIIEFLLI
jgi:hypothetical protein